MQPFSNATLSVAKMQISSIQKCNFLMQLFSTQKCSFSRSKNAAFFDPKMQLFSNQKCSFFRSKNAAFSNPKMQLFSIQKCSFFQSENAAFFSIQKCNVFCGKNAVSTDRKMHFWHYRQMVYYVLHLFSHWAAGRHLLGGAVTVMFSSCHRCCDSTAVFSKANVTPAYRLVLSP